MIPYGILPTGFVKKTFDDIITERLLSLQATFGTDFRLDPETPQGIFFGLMAAMHAEHWDLGEAIYDSRRADGAEGFALHDVVRLTGVEPQPATRTSVTVTITGAPATVVPITTDFIMSVYGSGDRFRLTAQVTIGGTGTVDGIFEALETGPVYAPLGLLNVVETPLAGVTSAVNAAEEDTLGTNDETDSALRARWRRELAVIGASTLPAIAARVSAMEDVTSVVAFENVTDVTDARGIPPHSVWVVCLDGTAADIAKMIFEVKAGGIRAWANALYPPPSYQSIVVYDKWNNPHDIGFNFANEKPVFVPILLVTGEVVWTAGNPQIFTVTVPANAVGIATYTITINGTPHIYTTAGAMTKEDIAAALHVVMSPHEVESWGDNPPDTHPPAGEGFILADITRTGNVLLFQGWAPGYSHVVSVTPVLLTTLETQAASGTEVGIIAAVAAGYTAAAMVGQDISPSTVVDYAISAEPKIAKVMVKAWAETDFFAWAHDVPVSEPNVAAIGEAEIATFDVTRIFVWPTVTAP